MLRIFILVVLGLLVKFDTAWAVMELSGDYGYNQRFYGSERENTINTITYSGSLVSYVFRLTALEFNYSQSQDVMTERTLIYFEEYQISQKEAVRTIKNTVYGCGIRQAFAGQEAMIRPMMSFGFAQQLMHSTGHLIYIDHDNGDLESKITLTESKKRIDSMYAGFILQIGLTKYFSLRGSVKTVFPSGHFSDAKDDIRYLAGFSWIL